MTRLVAPGPEARFASFGSYSDRGHHTSLPVEYALANSWVVHRFEDEPLSPEHGGPVRVVTPGKYFYKSIKWLDGIELTRRLAGPDVADPLAIVVITTFDLDEYVHGALKAGARGFLLKDAGPELLAQAVRSAASGDALIAPSVTARLLSTFSDLEASSSKPAAQPLDPLTEREEEVLVTVARGRTNAEIADDLCISLSTVKSHLASLMSKLGARNRVELAMWAYETDRMT